MHTVKQLEKLKDQGYEVPDRELRLANIEDRKANRPQPEKQDPLEQLTKQVVEIANRSDDTMNVVLQTLNEMLSTLSAPVVNIPKPEGWKEIEIKSSDGNKTWTLRKVK